MKFFDKFMLLFLLLTSNEKHQILSSTETLLLCKLYGNMQTLPMIDLVYNTLTTLASSATPVPSPFPYGNNDSRELSSALNQTSNWFSQSPHINNHSNNQILLGSGSLNFTNNIHNYNVTGGGVGGNYINGTFVYDDDSESDVHKEFIFDRTDVRIIFITLYSLVFCCCFFGKCFLIVIALCYRNYLFLSS